MKERRLCNAFNTLVGHNASKCTYPASGELVVGRVRALLTSAEADDPFSSRRKSRLTYCEIGSRGWRLTCDRRRKALWEWCSRVNLVSDFGRRTTGADIIICSVFDPTKYSDCDDHARRIVVELIPLPAQYFMRRWCIFWPLATKQADIALYHRLFREVYYGSDLRRF